MEKKISAETIQLLYGLWDSSLSGREIVLKWDSNNRTLETLSREESHEVLLLLRYMNRIGHLIEEEIFNKEFVTRFFGKEILRCYGRLENLILSARENREDPDYLEFIDKLVSHCKDQWPNYKPKYYQAPQGGLGFS